MGEGKRHKLMACAKEPAPLLSLQNITLTFGGLTAVDGFSMEIPRGAITGLIGPNGAGKTTAFNVLAGRLSPDSGKVMFEGADITKLAPHRRAALGIARTFQLPHEFARLTVIENLTAAADSRLGENIVNAVFRRGRFLQEERAIHERARDLLKFLGLDKLALQQAGALSGGQKKLMELGRALMREPKIVLLDEIGAGINRTLLSGIADRLLQLRAEKSIAFCLIEHDLDYVSKLCDSVYVMAGGKLLTHGGVAEVRADERVIEAYFGGGKYEARAGAA